MCGVFGYFDNNKQSLSSEQLKAMGDKIEH